MDRRSRRLDTKATRRRNCPNDRCWPSSPWHPARSRSWASSSHPLASSIASLAGRQPGMPSSSPWITSTGDEYLGSRIAVIRRTDAGWSKPKPITKVVAGGPRVDWHPTDDLIVFCTNDVGGLQVTDEPSNLFTVRSDGSKLSPITDYGPGKERATQPTWTADGRIIFDHITGANDEQRHRGLHQRRRYGPGDRRWQRAHRRG